MGWLGRMLKRPLSTRRLQNTLLVILFEDLSFLRHALNEHKNWNSVRINVNFLKKKKYWPPFKNFNLKVKFCWEILQKINYITFLEITFIFNLKIIIINNKKKSLKYFDFNIPLYTYIYERYSCVSTTAYGKFKCTAVMWRRTPSLWPYR